MKSDEIILNELELRDDVSVTYIMRKYHLNYKKSRELQNRWAANEPKVPTIEEVIEAYNKKLVERYALLRNVSAT